MTRTKAIAAVMFVLLTMMILPTASARPLPVEAAVQVTGEATCNIGVGCNNENGCTVGYQCEWEKERCWYDGTGNGENGTSCVTDEYYCEIRAVYFCINPDDIV